MTESKRAAGFEVEFYMGSHLEIYLNQLKNERTVILAVTGVTGLE